MTFKLLSRDEFREAVFERDKHRCVICGKKDNAASSLTEDHLDAHHIIERRLFPDGGYYIENGSSLCQEHHLAAEQTTLSCEEIRAKCDITKFPIPPHLYRDQPYDKWGNPILPNGMRLRGELFDDPSVQKIIQPVLALFTDRVKYSRTFHLPWSPGITDDDRVMTDLSGFVGQDVVATVKMDGENTTFYSDYIHARSIEYEGHPSRDWVKALHARIRYNIPKGWRVCGENLYAKHSIHYSNLLDYFLVFSIWDERNVCLSWADTKEYTALLELKLVPVLYEGKWDEKVIRGLYQPRFDGDDCEGYVVRIADSFHYKQFRNVIGKYVRASHITTHGHWMRGQWEPNKVRSK